MQMAYHSKDKMQGYILYITDYKVLCIFRTSTLVTGWSYHQSISMCPTRLLKHFELTMIKCTHNCKGSFCFHNVFNWPKPGKLLAICRCTKSLSEKRLLVIRYLKQSFMQAILVRVLSEAQQAHPNSHHIKKFQHYHFP